MTPFSARALDRGFAGAFLAPRPARARAELTPPLGAEQIAEPACGLEHRLLELLPGRACMQQPIGDEDERQERLASVQSRIVDLLDSWRRIRRRATQHDGVDLAIPALRGRRTSASR